MVKVPEAVPLLTVAVVLLPLLAVKVTVPDVAAVTVAETGRD